MRYFRRAVATLCMAIYFVPLAVLACTSDQPQTKTEYVTRNNVNPTAGLTYEIQELSDKPNPPDFAVEFIDIPIATETYEEEEVIVESTYKPNYISVGSTAFCDGRTADGTSPYYGTLAGKREWLGRSVELYDSDYNYMGSFTFHDVGYGRSTGYGESKLISGRSLGDIEAGETIDIWFPTESECERYGRRDIYMVWID